MARRTFRAILAILVVCGLVVSIAPTRASAAYAIPVACAGKQGKLICASKAQGRIFALKNGVIVKSAEARFGGRSSDGEFNRTREGAFRVIKKKADAVSTYYNVAMPYYIKFHWKGQGIHYSDEFARTGYRYGSHGCIGVRDKAFAAWLYNWSRAQTSTQKGTLVIIV